MSRAINGLPDGDTEQLKRELKHLRRLKVEDWRVLYEQDDRQRVITVRRVVHRSVAYD